MMYLEPCENANGAREEVLGVRLPRENAIRFVVGEVPLEYELIEELRQDAHNGAAPDNALDRVLTDIIESEQPIAFDAFPSNQANHFSDQPVRQAAANAFSGCKFLHEVLAETVFVASRALLTGVHNGTDEEFHRFTELVIAVEDIWVEEFM